MVTSTKTQWFRKRQQNYSHGEMHMGRLVLQRRQLRSTPVVACSNTRSLVHCRISSHIIETPNDQNLTPVSIHLLISV